LFNVLKTEDLKVSKYWTKINKQSSSITTEPRSNDLTYIFGGQKNISRIKLVCHNQKIMIKIIFLVLLKIYFLDTVHGAYTLR